MRCVAEGAGAISAARTGAIAQAIALTIALTLHFAFALALTQTRAFRARAALRTNSAVLFQARRLPGSALFSGLSRATVALALAARTSAGAILVLGEGGTNGEQARNGHDCDDVQLHN